MNSIVLQATINEADYPIFLGLFEKFNVKTVLLKKKVDLMKGYTDVRELFKDIDNE